MSEGRGNIEIRHNAAASRFEATTRRFRRGSKDGESPPRS
jgi:hypothetical protein